MFMRWDPELNILVDEMGIMIPKSTLTPMKEEIDKHLAHSDLELKALGRMSVERLGKSYALQFNWDYFE